MKHQPAMFNEEEQSLANRAIKYARARQARQRRENELRAAKEAEAQAARGKPCVFTDRAYYDSDANGYYRQWVGLEEHSLVELFDEYLDVHIMSSPVDVEVRCSRGTITIRRVDMDQYVINNFYDKEWMEFEKRKAKGILMRRVEVTKEECAAVKKVIAEVWARSPMDTTVPIDERLEQVLSALGLELPKEE